MKTGRTEISPLYLPKRVGKVKRRAGIVLALFFLIFSGEWALGARPWSGSASGHYLAFDHARRQGDHRLASSQALILRQLSTEIFQEIEPEALISLLQSGQLRPASAIAKNIVRKNPNAYGDLALLVQAISDIRNGRAVHPELKEKNIDPQQSIVSLLLFLTRFWQAYDLASPHAERPIPQSLSEQLSRFEAVEISPRVTRMPSVLLSAMSGDFVSAHEALVQLQDFASPQADFSRLQSALHAQILAQAGQFDQAQQVLSAHIEMHSADTPLFMEWQGRLARARAAKPPSLLTPRLENGREALGYCFLEISAWLGGNNTDMALITARLAYALLPDMHAILLPVSLWDMVRGQLEIGLAVLEEREDWGGVRYAVDSRRAVLLAASGREEEAIAVRLRSQKRWPQLRDAKIRLADLLIREKRYGQALPYLNSVLAEDSLSPEDWVLYYRRGIAFERTGEWPQAERDFLKSLELHADHPQVLNYLGYSWVEQGRNLPLARSMLERAVAQGEDNGFIIDSLGWAYYRLGEYEKAVQHLERAIALEPQEAVITDHLGDAYWQTGRQREARYQWQRARELNAQDQEIEDRVLARKLRDGLEGAHQN